MIPDSASPGAPPTIADLADRLHSVAIHLLRRLRRVDEQAGLSGPGLSALSVLVFGGPRSLGELASAEHVRPPTMTRLVRDLELRGLVSRSGGERDRRVVLLQATARGEALLKEGRSRRVEELAAWLGRLSGEAREVIGSSVALLEELVRPPSAAAAPTAAAPKSEAHDERGP